MNKVNLENIIKYGIYLLAFIPLVIFSEFMSPFHFGKVLVFRSLIEILAVFYIVLLVQKGKACLPPRTPLFWAVTLFTLAFGLTAFTSINFYQSFFGTLERMGGWFSFLHFWLFFVMASAILRKKEDWLTFIKLSLAASLLSAFYGFLQKTDWKWVIGSGGRNKIFGTLGNPALFAGYMIVNAFLALMMYFRPANSKNEKYFYGFTFLISALSVLLTGVRGSVLGVITGMALFGFLYSFNFSSLKIKKYTVSFLILVIAIAGILFSLRNAEFVKESHYLSRYADISPKSFTVQTRFWAWQAGFDGWNDSLRTMILGWGPEMFNVPFSKHFNPKFFRGLGSETLFDRAHNQFLEVLFTMGLIGFMAYILIFIRAFGVLKKLNDTAENKVFKIGLISALVAYAIHNAFIFDTAANYIVFFLAIGFINFLTIRGPKPAPENLKAKISLKASAFGLILAVLAGFSIYYFEIVPAKANYATTRGIVASWAGDNDLAFEKFSKAMSYDTFGKYEIRHRYGQYILEKTNPVSAIDKKNQARLFTAIENIKKNAEESPQDYLPYLYLSRIYIVLGKSDPASPYNDTALEYSLKAFEISPTFVRTYYEIAQAYLNKKDYQKAIEWFGKAVELNPEVALSHWYLGITTAQAGQFQKGAEIIEKSGYGYKSNEVDALRMLDIYARLNDFPKIAEVYEALIKLNPKDPQYHASLAVAYKQIGEKEKAIKEAEAAAKIDPSFAKEAQDFINSLR
ncbi:MAG: O-antigen ligase family protein [Parcubacteria group bacterium]|nr:O-antigen ligase family protein [Parcubacteria group bacterium]